jgi:hypothetical protein
MTIEKYKSAGGLVKESTASIYYLIEGAADLVFKNPELFKLQDDCWTTSANEVFEYIAADDFPQVEVLHLTPVMVGCALRSLENFLFFPYSVHHSALSEDRNKPWNIRMKGKSYASRLPELILTPAEIVLLYSGKMSPELYQYCLGRKEHSMNERWELFNAMDSAEYSAVGLLDETQSKWVQLRSDTLADPRVIMGHLDGLTEEQKAVLRGDVPTGWPAIRDPNTTSPGEEELKKVKSSIAEGEGA